MIELDLGRKFAYEGNYGYILDADEKGLFIHKDNKIVYLTAKNSIVVIK